MNQDRLELIFSRALAAQRLATIVDLQRKIIPEAHSPSDSLQGIMDHPNKSEATMRVNLTAEEIHCVKECMRIAAEDGSIFGGDSEGDAGYKKTDKMLDRIHTKLDAAKRATR